MPILLWNSQAFEFQWDSKCSVSWGNPMDIINICVLFPIKLPTAPSFLSLKYQNLLIRKSMLFGLNIFLFHSNCLALSFSPESIKRIMIQTCTHAYKWNKFFQEPQAFERLCYRTLDIYKRTQDKIYQHDNISTTFYCPHIYTPKWKNVFLFLSLSALKFLCKKKSYLSCDVIELSKSN